MSIFPDPNAGAGRMTLEMGRNRCKAWFRAHGQSWTGKGRAQGRSDRRFRQEYVLYQRAPGASAESLSEYALDILKLDSADVYVSGYVRQFRRQAMRCCDERTMIRSDDKKKIPTVKHMRMKEKCQLR